MIHGRKRVIFARMRRLRTELALDLTNGLTWTSEEGPFEGDFRNPHTQTGTRSKAMAATATGEPRKQYGKYHTWDNGNDNGNISGQENGNGNGNTPFEGGP